MQRIDKKIVFIGGVHRSGTTLLHSILRSHPMISGFESTGASHDEGQHLQTVYPIDQELGGVGNFGFYTGSAMDESHSLANPIDAERLWQQWGIHWDSSRPLFVEKSPANLIRTRYLQYCFPNSRFLIILRHPIATSYALRQRGWNTKPVPWLIEHALVCYERFLRDRSHLRHYHVLHYEDLVDDPKLHLNRIFSWLDVPSIDLRQSVHTGINKRYFDDWKRDMSGLSTGTERLLEARCNVFGYSLREPELRLPCSL